jgi:hypothetical protein
VNGDGVITIADAAMASRLASRTDLPFAVASERADVAGPGGYYRDARIDWRDVTRILRAAGGIEEIPDASVPYLDRISDSLNLSADTTKDYALTSSLPTPANTYDVSGHISGVPTNMDGNTLWFLKFYGAGGYSGSGVHPNAQGDYEILLSPDDYSLYYGATVVESGAGGTLSWSYKTSLNREITVSGPMTVDVTAAQPPTPGQVTGEIHTTNITPTRILGHPRPDFSSALDPSTNLGPSAGIVGTDAYVLKGVPMPYLVDGGAVYDPNPSILYNWSYRATIPLTSGSTVGPTITLPEVVPVTFNFASPDGAAVTSANLSGSVGTEGNLSTQTPPGVGADPYRTAFLPGVSQLNVWLTLDDPAPVQRVLSYRTLVTIPIEGGEQDIVLPPLSPTVTFSGRVTLPDGSPAPDAFVSLSPFALLGDPQLPYILTSARATTDADGRFSIPVFPGRYSVRISAS